MTAEESSSSSPSVDSYIGSVISLTSKSEIRYEGVLVSINTQESTIALQNVKSYGTEGRRKEGPQIPPSDKVYEYILFRGSDIKDLQVKSTPPVHPKQQTHNDPAIIQQSHYAYAPPTHNPAIPAASNSVPQDIGRQPFPDASSLLQTRAHFNSWMPSPAIANVDGPLQSQGYIGTSSGPAHAQQQSGPFHPHSIGLQNRLHYPEGYATTSMAKFPENAPSLTFPPQPANSNPYNSSSLLLSNAPLASSLPSHVLTMPPLSSSKNIASPPQSSFLPVSSMPSSSSSILGSSSGPITASPPLLTPNQLTNPIPAATSSLHKSYPEPKEKGALLPSSSTNTSSTVSGMPQEPLLPLPISSQQGERVVTQFNDEFDFTAMNEKFNKDEVWGSLGKEKQGFAPGDGTEDDTSHYNVEVNGGYGQDPPNAGSKTVYNKGDFFDTLSCNSLNRGGWSGRTRLSERRKLDTETFGEFQQGHPMGRGNNYGAPHSGYYRGSYNRGRGYGYYGGRGRGGGGGGGGGCRPSY